MYKTRSIRFLPRLLLILAINAALLGFGHYALAGTRNVRVARAQAANIVTTPENTPPSNLQLFLDRMEINEGGSVNLSATFDDPDIQDPHSAVINWGDGSSTPVNLTEYEHEFSTSHQYLDGDTAGTPSEDYSINVTVTDSANQSASASTILMVNNVAPEVGTITAPTALLNIYDPIISASAAFTEPWPVADSHTASWGWGDGASTVGIVTESDGSGIVSGSHTYGETGVYAVTLTVVDDDFGSGKSEPLFIVIYDPSAGFVTGGGWIDSPEGAYKPDPSLTGKANFGFVSKYKKGATTPTGNTEFVFKTAHLNFRSSEYEWLVVNQGGANAQFKGSGTINGAGDYKFMLWAGDGSSANGADTFRIRIWEEDEATAVETDIYDNGSDQALGAGSIVVHKGK